ncbi:hypothetical protein V12B01_13950 [Vibrio splendidus 12B01]|nr:hypothetical protein V12B01_13950 [Vibrio splendidus 12B01]
MILVQSEFTGAQIQTVMPKYFFQVMSFFQVLGLFQMLSLFQIDSLF